MNKTNKIQLNSQIGEAEFSENYRNKERKATCELEAKLFEIGYKIVIDQIKANTVDGFYSDYENPKPLRQAEFEIDQKVMLNLKTQISEEENNDGDLYLECGFSGNILLVFYQIGVKLHQEARYVDSINVFKFLTKLNPHIQSFWEGLGLGYEMNQEFYKAIESFERAIKTDSKNVSPFYGLIRCCESNKDISKSLELINCEINSDDGKSELLDMVDYIKSKQNKG